jgi:regulator of sigma E protease
LPFPPLDGGRVAVSLIQAATGNRIGEAAERLVYLTGFIALMALLVWVTFNDIQRLT